MESDETYERSISPKSKRHRTPEIEFFRVRSLASCSGFCLCDGECSSSGPQMKTHVGCMACHRVHVPFYDGPRSIASTSTPTHKSSRFNQTNFLRFLSGRSQKKLQKISLLIVPLTSILLCIHAFGSV